MCSHFSLLSRKSIANMACLQRIGPQGLRVRNSRHLAELGVLRGRYCTATERRLQDVFYSQTKDPSSSTILSSLKTPPRVAQTLTEKIVQRYSIGLGKDKVVKAGGMEPFISYRVLSSEIMNLSRNSYSFLMKEFDSDNIQTT